MLQSWTAWMFLGAIIAAAVIFYMTDYYAERRDWDETDDWFDRDEHDLAFLEDAYED